MPKPAKLPRLCKTFWPGKSTAVRCHIQIGGFSMQFIDLTCTLEKTSTIASCGVVWKVISLGIQVTKRHQQAHRQSGPTIASVMVLFQHLWHALCTYLTCAKAGHIRILMQDV